MDGPIDYPTKDMIRYEIGTCMLNHIYIISSIETTIDTNDLKQLGFLSPNGFSINLFISSKTHIKQHPSFGEQADYCYKHGLIPLDGILRSNRYFEMSFRQIIDRFINRFNVNRFNSVDAFVLLDTKQFIQFGRHYFLNRKIHKAVKKRARRIKKKHGLQYLEQKKKKDELISMFKYHPLCVNNLLESDENAFEILGY